MLLLSVGMLISSFRPHYVATASWGEATGPNDKLLVDTRVQRDKTTCNEKTNGKVVPNHGVRAHAVVLKLNVISTVSWPRFCARWNLCYQQFLSALLLVGLNV